MTIQGAIADSAARLLSRIVGLVPPSRWSVRLMHEGGKGAIQIQDGDYRYLFLATAPLLLWRAKTALSKEPETVAWLRSFSAGEVLFDIGANVGIYSILAGCRGVRVFAFEPEAANFAVLNRNIALNELEQTITAYSVAIADCMKLDRLRLSRVEPGAALHSLGPLDAATSDPPKFEQGCLSVSLDELVYDLNLPRPNHIKIDVDGLEDAIIAGSSQVISSPELRSVLIEVDEGDGRDSEAIGRLAAVGFRVVDRGELSFSGTARIRNLVLRRG